LNKQIKKTIQAYFRLFRLNRSLSAAFGVIFSGLIAQDLTSFQIEYVIAFFIVLFSTFANFGLNDYYDIETDILNHRTDRPLVQGTITRKTTLIVTAITSIIALLLTIFLNPLARLLIMLGLPLSLFYSIIFKKVLILKNASIGFAYMGIIFLGSIISDKVLEPATLYFAIIGFFVSLSYEVMLDIADVDGDKAMGIETIPTRFGIKTAAWFSIILGIFGIIVNPLPFFINIDNRLHRDYVYLILILIPIILRIDISKSLFKDQSKNSIFSLKKRVFRNIQLGCVCFLIGILF
jgi:4-hydroxybenzoate polyprenyltransferase